MGRRDRKTSGDPRSKVRIPLWAPFAALLLAGVGFISMCGAAGLAIVLLSLIIDSGLHSLGGNLFALAALSANFGGVWVLVQRTQIAAWIHTAASLIATVIIGMIADVEHVGGVVLMSLCLHGMVIFALAVFSGASGMLSPSLWRKHYLAAGRCPGCEYSLQGLPQKRCPECGMTWSNQPRS